MPYIGGYNFIINHAETGKATSNFAHDRPRKLFIRSTGCEDKFCHGRGVCAPKPKDPRNPQICRCEKGYYGSYCEDERKDTVFDLGGAKTKTEKKKVSKRKKKVKKVFATIGIVLLVILAVG